MIINDSGLTLSEEDITAFEKDNDCIIPVVYRTFLLKSNGGYPIPSEFTVQLKYALSNVSVDWFLGINVKDGISLKFYFDNYRNRIPKNLFPFATDPGGNLICIDTSNNQAIFYWDHDYEAEEGQPPTNDNIYFISDSFQEFMDSLEG